MALLHMSADGKITCPVDIVITAAITYAYVIMCNYTKVKYSWKNVCYQWLPNCQWVMVLMPFIANTWWRLIADTCLARYF